MHRSGMDTKHSLPSLRRRHIPLLPGPLPRADRGDSRSPGAGGPSLDGRRSGPTPWTNWRCATSGQVKPTAILLEYGEKDSGCRRDQDESMTVDDDTAPDV